MSNAPNISIKLEQYGSIGWQWTERVLGGKKFRYRTNSHGDGLWVCIGQWADGDPKWRQIKDFDLYLPHKRKAAYSKIRYGLLKELKGRV